MATTILTAVFCLLATALANAAGEPQVRRCETAGGAVRYQATACAAGEREVWRRAIGTPPPRAAERSSGAAARAIRPPAPRPAPRRRPYAASVVPRAEAAARTRCERARAAADTIRDERWNRLDFRARSALDARVARACAR
jgi:hypothetical protein